MTEAHSLVYVTGTDKAICVAEPQEGETFWLPKSVIEVDYDEELGVEPAEGEIIDVLIPEWLAEEKGLI